MNNTDFPSVTKSRLKDVQGRETLFIFCCTITYYPHYGVYYGACLHSPCVLNV